MKDKLCNGNCPRPNTPTAGSRTYIKLLAKEYSSNRIHEAGRQNVIESLFGKVGVQYYLSLVNKRKT